MLSNGIKEEGNIISSYINDDNDDLIFNCEMDNSSPAKFHGVPTKTLTIQQNRPRRYSSPRPDNPLAYTLRNGRRLSSNRYISDSPYMGSTPVLRGSFSSAPSSCSFGHHFIDTYEITPHSPPYLIQETRNNNDDNNNDQGEEEEDYFMRDIGSINNAI